MILHLFAALILPAPVLLPVPSTQDAAPSQSLTESIDARAAQLFEQQDLVGLALAVVRPGQPLHTATFGFANREQGVPVSDDTLFRWASISKPLTAIAAMQLVQRGELDLDQDVRHYVPEFPAKPHAVTARQLLGHRGGIVHYTNGAVVRTEVDYEVEHPFADVVVALDRFKDSPLIAEPGTRYAYTTHGYILLGAVVQRAGGAPYWQQVRDRIARPLSMTSLRPDYQWEDIPGRARGYRRMLKRVIPSTDTDVSWKLPGGGFVSTVGDLARFASGLMGETLVTPETRATMWTRQSLPGGKKSSYGLGLSIGEARGRRLISHSGAQEKTRTLMHLFPDQQIAVVLMTNSEYASLAPIAKSIEAVIFP